MDELIVIKVMNEAMIKVLKSKNEDCSKNEKLQEFLEDENFFKKISKDRALVALSIAGVADEKLEETYKKLISK